MESILEGRWRTQVTKNINLLLVYHTGSRRHKHAESALDCDDSPDELRMMHSRRQRTAPHTLPGRRVKSRVRTHLPEPHLLLRLDGVHTDEDRRFRHC